MNVKIICFGTPESRLCLLFAEHFSKVRHALSNKGKFLICLVRNWQHLSNICQYLSIYGAAYSAPPHHGPLRNTNYRAKFLWRHHLQMPSCLGESPCWRITGNRQGIIIALHRALSDNNIVQYFIIININIIFICSGKPRPCLRVVVGHRFFFRHVFWKKTCVNHLWHLLLIFHQNLLIFFQYL